MNNFVFEYPTKVYFGNESAKEYLTQELAKVGTNVMLAYGGGSIKRNGIYEEFTSILEGSGKTVFEFSGIMSNPTYAKVLEGINLAKENDIDFILAVGGGSVIDCCKVVSTGAKLDEDIWEFEYSKGGVPSEFIPMGAVVTAFGTGAEMNNGAVITNEEKMMKSPLWGAFYDFAILDPEYTMTMPMKQVISGSFDTLSHCMETYFGKPSDNNLSDDINEAVMRSVITNIRKTIANPEDREARSELIWASAMGENGILKIGKITDFQCHMLEHQLGAYTDCNHGQGLAVIHPVLYRHIYKEGVDRFARFASNVWNISEDGKTKEESALAGIESLAEFIKEIGLPTSFGEMNISDDIDLKAIADSTMLMPGCCKQLDTEELLEILEECM